MFVKNGTGVLKKVLMSPPSYLEAAPINEIAKKWSHTRLDREKMKTEFQSVVEAYRNNGVEVVQLEAAENRPNSVFSRDFGGCIREGYILGRFREPIRFAERDAYRNKLDELGIPLVGEVKEGLFEGGDFAWLDDRTLAVGVIARTDAQGIAEIRAAVEPLGYSVVPVPCDPSYLHMDLLFNLVAEDLALVYRPALPQSFLELLDKKGIETIDVPAERVFHLGCNLEAIGNRRVIALKSNYAVNDVLARHKIDVTEVDVTEICKAGGGPHCMSFPLKRV